MPSKKAKKPEAPPPAGVKDTIAKNRTLAFSPAEVFPDLPKGFQPTRHEERRRRLRPMPEDMIAEGLRALHEIADKAADIRADFGEDAPDTTPAEPLAGRIAALEGALARQRALLAAYEELEDIALSDAVEMLEAVHAEYEHRLKKRPSLATKYPKLAAYFAMRSRAISDGMARARLEPATESQPV